MMATSHGSQQLLSCARDPADVATQAFAGVLPRFGIRGLSGAGLSRLLHRYFPGVTGVADSAAASTGCAPLHAEEFDDLLALLREHRSRDTEENDWLAHAVASACLGDNHLWQDLGLPNRDALSQLLQRHFTTLYEKNTGNMKWKKFFYKQLCERAEVFVCKAPSCSVCTDYAKCFGPEEGDVAAASGTSSGR
jgi:nitrogen fixation protein NifQ